MHDDMDIFVKLIAALYWPIKLCSIVTFSTWLLSIITGNVSHVDRLWTFLPTIYATYYALLPTLPRKPPFFLYPSTPWVLGPDAIRDFSPRAVLMLTLIYIWMFRLTYNAYRRGILNLSEEDYRWAVLRAKLPTWLFQVVNLTFTAITQNVILFLLSYPVKVASVDQPHTSLLASDIVLAVLAVITLLLEFISDNQQYSFQTYKKAYFDAKKAKKPVAFDTRKQWFGSRFNWTPADAQRGFVTRGFWASSRHPNVACEQLFWWLINLIPLVSPSSPNLIQKSDFFSSLTTLWNFPSKFSLILGVLGKIILYTLPALSHSLLLFSSSLFTESISMGKYPSYKAYRERVAIFGGPMTLFKRLRLWRSGREIEINALLWSQEENQKKE